MKTYINIMLSLFVINATTAQKADKTEKPNKVKINNLRLVNTPDLEFSPAFYNRDLVFVSTNTIAGRKKVFDKNIKLNSMSLFISKKDRTGYYRKPIPFDTSFISNVHDGPLSFDSQNEIMYFTRNDIIPESKKPRYVDKINHLRIYSAAFAYDEWGKAESLSFNDEKSDACHPAISADGQKIIFASNREGGFGGMDLYMCQMVDGAWGNPVNLGEDVNTDKNELFPFIHEDGTLYFSSNRPKGLGGLDIYYTRIDNTENYIQPSPLPRPFNTDKDDFGFIVDGDNKTGFLASNRNGGLGGDDIYHFTIPEGTKPFSDVKQISDAYKTTEVRKNERLLSLYIVDRKSGLPLSKSYVCISSTGVKNPTTETADKNCETIITDENGKVVLRINQDSNYFVRVYKPDFKPDQLGILKGDNKTESIVLLDKVGDPTSPKKEEVTNLDSNLVHATVPIEMSPHLKDRIYQLRNIYYDYDAHELRADAIVVLDSLIEVLDEFPEMEIELAAYTDSRGNMSYNLALSKRRANSVIEYLLSKGIKRKRLNAVGYGKQQLTNECGDDTPCPPEKHQENRRTEVRVIKSGGSEGRIHVSGRKK
jgi:outer membrane protein OmpA-like peptidoglycan-associated protein